MPHWDRPCPRPPRSTAATAPAASPTSSGRSTSCARCATPSSRTSVHHAYLFVGLAGDRQDVDGQDPRRVPELRERGPHGLEPCGVCDSCALDRQRDLAGRHRDGRRVQQLGRRHPRPARAPSPSRRSPAATRSTSSTRRTCSRRRRGTRSSRRSRSRRRTRSSCWPRPRRNKVLPTVVDRCHRFDFTRPTVEQLAGVVQPRGRRASRSRSPTTRSRCSPATRPAPSATRSARSSSSSPTPGTTIAIEDVLAVLGVADADLLFGALDAVAAHDARAALHAVGAPGRHGPRRRRASCATSRPTRASCWSCRRSARSRRRSPSRPTTTRGWPSRPGASPRGDVVRAARPAGRRAARDEGRRRRRARSSSSRCQGRHAARSTPSTRALLARIERLERTLAAAPRVAAGRARAARRAGAAAADDARRPTPPAARRRRPAPPPPDPAAAAPEPAARAEPEALTRPAAAAEAPVAVAEPAREPGDARPPALLELWPAVLDAVREEHALLAALPGRGAARLLDGRDARARLRRVRRLPAPPVRGRESTAIVAEAVRTLAGTRPASCSSARPRRARRRPGGRPPGGAAPPPARSWVDRFKAEFDADRDPARRPRPVRSPSLMPQPPT